MRLIQPQTSDDFEKYYRLRWEILRKPWNQPAGTEKDEHEDSAFHLMALNENNECTGVVRLQHNSATEGQVRFMAVRDDQQGKGLGKKLMQQIEAQAKNSGMEKIVLQARENAVPFYESIGYTITEKSFKLWDIIQHFKMEKSIR
jgi:predicted GNAT family N-acyltransferase